MVITLSPTEANALIQILDVATKAGGLNVAEACVFFQKTINNAQADNNAQAEEPPVETPETETL